MFLLILNFGVLLVLARVIPPDQYGLSATALGVFGLINCLNCSSFIAHAVNQPTTETPDWSQHWYAGNFVQLLLTIALNAVALVARLFPDYTSLSLLLHVGSIGLLLDAPNQISFAQLRREMNFPLLRKIHMACSLLTAIVSVTLALLGWGALSLIIGSNVLHGLPFGLHLLFIKRWRPDGGWWRMPDWKRYAPSLKFGFQLSGSFLLEKGRVALETVVLPAAFGFATLGLWNRAQVLLTTTGGRLTTLLVETIYPLLPRSRHIPDQFAHHTSLFLRGTLLVLLPSAAFILLQGPALLLLFYGPTWSDAIPYLPAATLFVAGTSVNMLLSFVLLAAERLRICFLSNLIIAFMAVVALVVAFLKKDPHLFAWVAVGGQWLGVCIVARWVARYLQRDWLPSILLPPVISSVFAIGASLLLTRLNIQTSWLAANLMLHASVFTLSFALSMRLLYATHLTSIVQRMPFATLFRRLFVLPA